MADLTREMRDVPIESLHEVRARFHDADAMDRAVANLEMSGFDRADLSLPEAMPPRAEDTPEAGAKSVDTEEDARQARTLHTSAAASLAGMAAAGVVIATGGAAAPAVAAAAAGAGLAGSVAYGLSSAANRDEQVDRNQRAATGDLILSVRAANAAKREQAQAILREAGAPGWGPPTIRSETAMTRLWLRVFRPAIRLLQVGLWAAGWGVAPPRRLDPIKRIGTEQMERAVTL